MNTILVPIDFSPHSGKALDTAIFLGRKFESRVDVLLAFSLPITPATPGEIIVPNDVWGTDRDGARARLAECLERVHQANLQGDLHLVDDHPDRAIVACARDLPADLIVMGTRGRSGLSHVLMGSVAERTLRLAPCPVLTVKDVERDETFEAESAI